MILVIDVGNTNCTVGVYEKQKLLKHWRMTTDRHRTSDELGMTVLNFFSYANLTPSDIQGIIISSVVPPIMHAMETMCVRYFNIRPLIVGPGIKTGLNLKVDNPREIGSDRIVNAVAASEEYGTPVIVVDFGTATTFCYIDESGVYQGGAIAPGIMISTEALYNRAAKLPRVDIAESSQIIGKSTVSSMQAGIFYGFVGQCEGIIAEMKKQSNASPVVVATGGLARMITGKSSAVDILDPFLTLKGLELLYRRNKPTTEK
ncbi:TPA_asm: type III pantothenate kinase [Listeria monocytogenes]|nr:type III pantothenate kinase [Listeria monocytogenes]HAB9698285.1 type III pantothenate kinase [Listeria monocytogenes]HAB9939410.1 type III pantothenate kinase [Listeria monocytogenes]HAC3004910.1 type III pantothenate kinase [Listeria monocytogenes]HAC3090357.1 type III pantothenate kinase [Listeria monocytogenes]